MPSQRGDVGSPASRAVRPVDPHGCPSLGSSVTGPHPDHGGPVPEPGEGGASASPHRVGAPTLAGIDNGELLAGMARSQPRQRVTAPAIEVVDLVADLGALARLLLAHNMAVMTGEPHDWAILTDSLAQAYKAAKRQVVINQEET